MTARRIKKGKRAVGIFIPWGRRGKDSAAFASQREKKQDDRAKGGYRGMERLPGVLRTPSREKFITWFFTPAGGKKSIVGSLGQKTKKREKQALRTGRKKTAETPLALGGERSELGREGEKKATLNIMGKR